MPTTSRLHLNLAIALHRLGRFAEAECSYEEAVQMEPDFAEAQWNRGLAHLLNGNYPSGLKLYEWRFRHEDLHLKRKILNTPEWDRGVSIRKKTLFLYAEQGLGDTLQFIRFASVLERMGASVIVEVQPPLRDFLSGSLPYRFISQGEPTPSHDYHYPLMSLPYALNTTVMSIPHPESYLHPDLKRVGRWTSRLGDRGSLRVGLVVSGNPRHINDRNRSIPLRAVIESLPSGCDYFLLQKEIREGDLADAIDHKNKVSVLDDISDFDDTAALCSLMDLVISVDTSVAHLSAGLGTPTWILLPWIPDWRWLMNSVSSPWYNSVRLYRQDARQNWMTVLAEVSHDLKRDPRFDS
jgi:tetratricopeptide (TPR) repeat protein